MTTKAICLRLPIEHIKCLKRIARKQSYTYNVDKTYQDLIKYIISKYIEKENEKT